MQNNVLTIAKNLIACPSVTPKDEGAQVYLEEILSRLGFTCHALPFGEGNEAVPNLFARIGTDGPHLCYAGHTDVVPTGPEDEWTFPAFKPTVHDGRLYGRGASDMKGSVAAFVSACAAFIEKHGAPQHGSISLLITGDEEGPAVNGTVKVLEWMKEHSHIPDVALVGEPTNPSELGQEVKVGRRGSLNGILKVQGKQGHVAYQHLADNPLPRLAAFCQALSSHEFDQGTEYFAPTNLEITSIDVGNSAENVIPGAGTVMFNIRFNDLWDAQKLEDKLREILGSVSDQYSLETRSNADSFITSAPEWAQTVSQAVEDITGKTPKLTTTGGTSDARFVAGYCPVVEFGGINETIHKIDENAKVEDLENLSRIFLRIMERYFSLA